MRMSQRRLRFTKMALWQQNLSPKTMMPKPMRPKTLKNQRLTRTRKKNSQMLKTRRTTPLRMPTLARLQARQPAKQAKKRVRAVLVEKMAEEDVVREVGVAEAIIGEEAGIEEEGIRVAIEEKEVARVAVADMVVPETSQL